MLLCSSSYDTRTPNHAPFGQMLVVYLLARLQVDARPALAWHVLMDFRLAHRGKTLPNESRSSS